MTASPGSQNRRDRTLLAVAVLQRPRVWRTALGILHDADAAEDIAQEVFLRLHRSRPKFDHESQLIAWLHRVALNLCRDHLRRTKRRTRALESEITDAEVDLARSPDPAALLDRDRARAALEQALHRLPEDQALAVRMRYLDGFDYAGIASRLGVPIGTIASRVFRGLKRLGDHVERTHLEILR